ncbi:MAG: protein kinase [Proteobacteria bacterium]|nr:protein kinase [Pseudomonadota bacterium]
MPAPAIPVAPKVPLGTPQPRPVPQPPIAHTQVGTNPQQSSYAQAHAHTQAPTPANFRTGVTAQTQAPQIPTTTANPHAPTHNAAGDLELLPGTYIHHYELIRELGRGGMGIVYAARDTKLGRRVAMKFLLHATQDVAERFLIEARATAQCNHENIVIIHEVDQVETMPFMVLEFLEGTELRKQLGAFSSGNRLPPSRVVELMLPVARALARAHQLGIVHRDLKPENVFVTTAGQVKVLDFGIAKATGLGDGSPRRTAAIGAPSMQLTGDEGLVGTLPYMSPEQFGVDTVDHRSDIWSFGVIMYEMLVGFHPVEPLTPHQLMLSAGSLDESMPSVMQSVHDIDPALSRVVDLCLRKRKNERIGTAADLVRKLEELLPGRRGRQLAEGESPYPGLTAFQENDADRFFGRARDVAKMVARVRENPLTGVIGPSGVGKSSFVRAGVGPSLKASGETWEVVTIRPGRQPLAALSSIAHRLTTRSGPFEGQLGEHDQLMSRLRTEPGYLGSLLRQRARQTGGFILLFIDQFEELYTLVPDLDERRAFTAAIAGVADDAASPLRVVVSMRSDFLDRVAEDPQFMDDLARGLVFLQPPDRGGLRDALTQPIEMIGHRFETNEIVEDMLNALGQTTGALPLLQFAAAKLWDARDRTHRVLTLNSYRAIGGISGALASHADEVVQNMNAPAQKLTQMIMRRLVTPERTRAIIELADLHALTNDPSEAARVIDLLVAARLLVVQTRGDGGGGTVEIVHESLIDRWPTLRRWLDEDQEDAAYLAQLAAAAKQWESRGKAAGLLWRGDAMEEARRWHGLRRRTLSPRDQAFLDAVFALARRGKRVKRTVLSLVFLMLGGVAVGAVIMLMQVRAAEAEAMKNLGLVSAQMAETEKAMAETKKAMAETKTAMAASEEARAKEKAAYDKQKAAESVATQSEADKRKAEEAKAAAEAEAKRIEADKLKGEVLSAAQLKDKNDRLEKKAVENAVLQKKTQEALEEVRRANLRQESEIKALKDKLKNAGPLTNTLKGG